MAHKTSRLITVLSVDLDLLLDAINQSGESTSYTIVKSDKHTHTLEISSGIFIPYPTSRVLKHIPLLLTDYTSYPGTLQLYNKNLELRSINLEILGYKINWREQEHYRALFKLNKLIGLEE